LELQVKFPGRSAANNRKSYRRITHRPLYVGRIRFQVARRVENARGHNIDNVGSFKDTIERKDRFWHNANCGGVLDIGQSNSKED